MEKIVKLLCSIGSDKYVHLLSCLLITFIVGQGVFLFGGGDLPTCAAIGAVVAFLIGCAKEVYDEFTGGEVGWTDLIADALGCLLGILVTAF